MRCGVVGPQAGHQKTHRGRSLLQADVHKSIPDPLNLLYFFFAIWPRIEVEFPNGLIDSREEYESLNNRMIQYKDAWLEDVPVVMSCLSVE